MPCTPSNRYLQSSGRSSADIRMDIIVNFEHLRQATPDAIHTLLDGDMLKAIAPYANLRYRKFKDAFQTALQELTLPDSDLLEEIPQDA